MKIFLTTIARLEHDYIVEFVEHYKKIGITKIFLYDNGYDDEPTYDSILCDYIKDGFVEIIDYRNKKNCQIESYNDFYKKHGGECDWAVVCDCDEFLFFKEDKNIEEYLNREIFSDKGVILVNWTTYGDNNIVYKYSNDIVNRFTSPSETPFYNNNLPKAIIRGGLSDILFDESVHMPEYVDSIKFCTEDGIVLSKQDENGMNLPWIICHKCKLATFNHYRTKSLQEYCEKVKRGNADRIIEDTKKEFANRITEYFKINEITNDKLTYLSQNYGIILNFSPEFIMAKEHARNNYKSLL